MARYDALFAGTVDDAGPRQDRRGSTREQCSGAGTDRADRSSCARRRDRRSRPGGLRAAAHRGARAEGPGTHHVRQPAWIRGPALVRPGAGARAVRAGRGVPAAACRARRRRGEPAAAHRRQGQPVASRHWLPGRPAHHAWRAGRGSATPARQIVRLESIAEQVARAGTTANGWADAFAAALSAAVAEVSAVGFKSIVAYRFGFDFDPARPSGPQVAAAAGRLIRRWRMIRPRASGTRCC